MTLGARSEGGVAHWSWKAEGEPDAQVEDEVRTRGNSFSRRPDGQWTFKDLGELEHLKELKDLPAKIRMMIPKHGTQSTKTFIEGGQKRVITKVEDDGHSITIKQENEDEITVTRTDERGKEATATYDSEEALKDGDAEAYAMLENAGDVQVFGVDGDGPGFLHLDLDVDVDADDLGEHVQEWREKMEKGLWEARETYEKAVEEMQRLREEWHNGKGIQAFHDLHDQLGADGHGTGVYGQTETQLRGPHGWDDRGAHSKGRLGTGAVVFQRGGTQGPRSEAGEEIRGADEGGGLRRQRRHRGLAWRVNAE